MSRLHPAQPDKLSAALRGTPHPTRRRTRSGTLPVRDTICSALSLALIYTLVAAALVGVALYDHGVALYAEYAATERRVAEMRDAGRDFLRLSNVCRSELERLRFERYGFDDCLRAEELARLDPRAAAWDAAWRASWPHRGVRDLTHWAESVWGWLRYAAAASMAAGVLGLALRWLQWWFRLPAMAPDAVVTAARRAWAASALGL